MDRGHKIAAHHLPVDAAEPSERHDTDDRARSGCGPPVHIDESDEDDASEHDAKLAAFKIELQQSSLQEHHRVSIEALLLKRDSTNLIIMRYDSLEAIQAGEMMRDGLQHQDFIPPSQCGGRDSHARELYIEEQVTQAKELRYKELQESRERKFIMRLKAKSRKHVRPLATALSAD